MEGRTHSEEPRAVGRSSPRPADGPRVAPVKWGDDEERSASPAPGAIGYASVAPDAQESRRAVLQTQATEIEAGCRRFGLELLEVVNDLERASGRARLRPGLKHVLERLAAGESSV